MQTLTKCFAINYKLEFLSSFLQGSGDGVPGLFDDVSVNQDGIPFVQGAGIAYGVRTVLRNLWKSKGESFLCGGQKADPIDPSSFCKSSPPCLYCRMFGRATDRQRMWEFGDATLPEEIRQQIMTVFGNTSRHAAFLRHARCEINDNLRRAEENLLFAFGRAIPLDKFQGKVWYLGNGDPEPDQEKAIRLGLKLLEGLGRGKKRGYGQVECEVMDEKKNTTEEEVSNERRAPGKEKSKSIEAVKITIKLLSETGFPVRHEHGNIYESLQYIPGRAIWGALASLYGGLDPHNACTSDEMNFFYEDLRVYSGFPIVNYQPCYPVPLSARRDKRAALPGEENPLGFDWGESKLPDILFKGLPHGEATWVPVTGKFLQMRAGKWEVAKPYLVWRAHNTQRAPSFVEREADGSALFATQVFPIGEEFGAWLDCVDPRSKPLFDAIIVKLEKTGHLILKGRVHEVKIDSRYEHWGEMEHLFTPVSAANEGEQVKLWLTFLSPALVSDGWRRTMLKLDGEWLKAYLVAQGADHGIKIKLESHYSSMDRVNGWSGAWNLPLSQEGALAQGSTFIYTVENVGNFNQLNEALKTFQRRGVGRRRSEGYGQVAVNWGFHKLNSL